MSLSSLAYIGLGVSSVDAWATMALDVFGMAEVRNPGRDERRFRLDDRAWRLELIPSPEDDLIFAGYEVPDRDALSHLAEILQNEGVEWRAMDAIQLEERCVVEGITAKDPGGLSIEIVRGLASAESAFRSPRGREFVAGEQGLGHIVLYAADVPSSLKFYQLLGFELSDHIEFEIAQGVEVELTFLHCNARHHTLALIPAPMERRLDHLMLESTSVDAVIESYYQVQQLGLPVVRHLGRHTNDRMLSFYARTPAGFDIEYGWGGIQIGSDCQPGRYDSISLWGHEPGLDQKSG